MLADDAAHVAPIGARLAAETGGEGAELDGKPVRVERLVAVEVGHGDFGRRRQPQVRVLNLEQVLGELGQLPGAEKARRVDQKRRQDFGIPVLARVRVEHEARQRAFELCAQAQIDGEAPPGDLGGSLQVQDAEFRSQVPVRLGLEIELARRAPAVDFDVGLRARTHRHRLVSQVRNTGQRLPELVVELRHLFIESRDAVAQFAHLLLEFGGVDALLAQLSDFGALGILQRLQLLGFGHGRAAARVQLAEFLDIEGEPTRREARGDGVEVGSEEVQVVHGSKLR